MLCTLLGQAEGESVRVNLRFHYSVYCTDLGKLSVATEFSSLVLSLRSFSFKQSATMCKK